VIVTHNTHGRHASDARRLARHLAKSTRQTVRIASSSRLTPGLALAPALDDIRRSVALSLRAAIGFHHITINPARLWSQAQRDEAARRILAELGATGHAWMLVEHSDKARAMPGGSPAHFHLVVAHVGPTGRALDTRQSFARLEAVARACEVDFGERITPSRRATAVATRLRRMGRADVAAMVQASGRRTPTPRSAMTSDGRQRAARLGLDLPAARGAVRDAWRSAMLIDSLAAAGLQIALGAKRGVLIVKTRNGEFVGALDRLARVSRSAAVARVEAEMARPKSKKGPAHEQRDTGERQQSNAGPARSRRVERRSRDEGDGGGDSGAPESRRCLARPRLADAHRGNAVHAPDDPGAADRRHRRAVAEQRRADAIARRRQRAGRSRADEVQAAKAALWRHLFGAELSPELVVALAYVDVQERVARLTAGGWVRDAGDRLYASGAHPDVVALMVEAARAKGWTSVRVWGPPEFIAEATRQFEAAGIPVTVTDAPPDASARPQAPSPAPEAAADVLAELHRQAEAAEARLNELREPGDPPAELAEAQIAERKAIERRYAEFKREANAADALAVAEAALDSATFFHRAATRRALAAATADHAAALAAFREAFDRHAEAKKRVAYFTAEFDRREQRRRGHFAGAVASAEASLAFARECERAASASPELAARGIAAVRVEVSARFAREESIRREQETRDEVLASDDLTKASHP